MQTERLIYTDLGCNNNKYWHVYLDGSDVRTEWGRVGDPPQSKTFHLGSTYRAEHDFQKRINDKLRHGYTKQQTMTEVKQNMDYVAKVQIEHANDKETEHLIDFLVQRNIHAIEGITTIKFFEGKLTTPLGPVTLSGLNEAQRLLSEMATGKNLDRLANEYLRIVPRTLARTKTDPKALFGTLRQLEAEQATLDSLRAVVNDTTQRTEGPVIFQTRLVPANKDDFNKVSRFFTEGWNSRHQSSRMKLKRVWEMSITSAEQAFEEKIGNVKTLWHGTADANLLSILKGGYKIPNRNSGIRITGRMFGDGIYFSDQSTKSLNYASGYWGASSNRCFMLLNSVALGKEYLAQRSFSGTIPKGYDSCFAKAGYSGVINNEMIVYRTSQVKPQFLCEFA